MSHLARASWLAVALLAACGGSVLVDSSAPGGGDGGAGASTSSSGSGGSTSTSGSGGSSTSSGTTTSTSASGSGGCDTPPPDDCESACKALFYCTQQDDLCPGMQGISWESFAYGGGMGGGCLQICQQQKALIAVVDPCDCAGTMATLLGASPQLKQVCQGGNGQCLGCAEFITECQGYEGCPDPDDLCPGSMKLLMAVVECLCTDEVCAYQCQQSCTGEGEDSPDCGDCQNKAIQNECSYELGACANDVQ
ncbi:MAG: hypothetical protein HY744_30235 [Deltaproteobacteria bacterium]|nr:hypothetical protein [Deltaproteobacteria bacterium]